MRALAQMNPGQGKLDPKLYQYGGLWIYPVGAMLKGASRIGAIQLSSDLTFYLDHPEAFGRFYVVARLYSALWGVLGAWAVFWLVRRISGGLVAPATAAVCYIFMPVVLNMAHEAKPHLPGAVLALLAVIAATKCADTRRRRWAALAGALCGAATGMVLSGVLSFIILPFMAMTSAIQWWRRIQLLAMSVVAGGIVYAASNPYVIGHLLHDQTVLRSNLQNSTAMYRAPASARGIRNGIVLIGQGASPLIACAGVIAVVAAIRRRRDAPGWMLFAACGIVVIQFLTLATNKPGEYGRFAVLPDVGLAISAVAGICAWMHRPVARRIAFAVLVLSVIPCGLAYEWQFVRDSREPQTRLIAAARLAALSSDVSTIVLPAEPAPYNLPPVNLFERKLILTPRAGVAIPGPWLSVTPVDRARRETFLSGADESQYLVTPPPIPTPISWAGKSFEVVKHQPGAPGG
jgi:4-amino-4-deoxy-L-arabinose transferase-like glycosyltransferase